ncbi:hypothetical protein BPMI_02749 [Candidatus Burkholderia pumila]|uniref:Tautomerase n=1 Tax=Candidatus Burkholderia pumila TaxID=1090375 RepID=A0ABR5HJZ0_9BURK|nr:hypothetical protein BPMI_02749 [Candidatus Burkholderia pumila]
MRRTAGPCYSIFDAEDFFAPQGATHYLSIEITLFAGRSLNTKRRLYRRVVDNVVTLRGIDPVRVLMLLREEPFDNWGMRNGHAAIDLRFDYMIEMNVRTRGDEPHLDTALLNDALPVAGVAFWANGEAVVMATADPALLTVRLRCGAVSKRQSGVAKRDMTRSRLF